MRKRWIGYAAWLLFAACLYFFENNTGTRVVLLCSLLLPFVPPLRAAFFSPDDPVRTETQKSLTVRVFARQEPEESGNIRQYIPGDPVRRIHWKLSAKKDELLVRDMAAGSGESEQEKGITVYQNNQERKARKRTAAIFAAGMLLCVILILLIPEARHGTQALCNRLFTASEAVNSYIYPRFPVPKDQNVLPAAIILLCASAFLAGMTAVFRSRLMALGIMAVCMLSQAYFGLAFPSWINIALCSLFAVWTLRRPAGRKSLTACGVFILLVTLFTAVFLAGVNADTETASEKARDHLARMAEQITGTVQEMPAGEMETRHIHTRSMDTGSGEAETEQVFRLVTVEEEQISLPHWVNWMKIILLLLLSVILLFFPFAPFLLLNARKMKAQADREAFKSENVNEGIRAIFRQIILWLETVGSGEENLLFREWSGRLPDGLPEGYADRFSRCAADFEEAVYSTHPMPEQKRRSAMELLKETETVLWKRLNWKQRLYLKYWMCLHE